MNAPDRAISITQHQIQLVAMCRVDVYLEGLSERNGQSQGPITYVSP